MVVGIANAIESALKTEEKIYQLDISNKFFKTLIESMEDGLIVINEQRGITHLNQIAENILGRKIDDVMGEPINELIDANFSLFNILNNRKESRGNDLIERNEESSQISR